MCRFSVFGRRVSFATIHFFTQIVNFGRRQTQMAYLADPPYNMVCIAYIPGSTYLWNPYPRHRHQTHTHTLNDETRTRVEYTKHYYVCNTLANIYKWAWISHNFWLIRVRIYYPHMLPRLIIRLKMFQIKWSEMKIDHSKCGGIYVYT